MSTTSKAAAKRVPTFPAKAVADCLRDELVDAVQAAARRKGTAIPATPKELVGAQIEIDSLVVVEILCALDEILPFQVDESVVRAGGYDSIGAAVLHVVGRVESKWQGQL